MSSALEGKLTFVQNGLPLIVGFLEGILHVAAATLAAE